MFKHCFLPFMRQGFLAVLALLLATSAWSVEVTSSLKREWPRTNFAKHSIPLEEIISGGPPKDGIPPIDTPRFVTVSLAKKWLSPREPVMVFQGSKTQRAYPLQILIWHEIVNDTVDGQPISVTYCPLCNSALAFDRRLGSRVLDFGTTGKLRGSDLVMWDRQTESWWQQITGEAIVGSLTGSKLKQIPAPVVSFQTFAQIFPKGQILSRETGSLRSYGRNPYVGYDRDPNQRPFLLDQIPSKRLPAKERVLVVEVGASQKVYPFSRLAKSQVINDTLGDTPIVVFFQAEVASPVDNASFNKSRNVGAAAAFKRSVKGKKLVFKQIANKQGKSWIDSQTNSHWNFLGKATKGSLNRTQLQPLNSGVHFAFAWLRFHPNSDIYQP